MEVGEVEVEVQQEASKLIGEETKEGLLAHRKKSGTFGLAVATGLINASSYHRNILGFIKGAAAPAMIVED
jgi:hypothetical protein